MSNTITAVRLLNVPLENDYLHTLYFDSKATQETYFASKIVKSGSDFSYQRKDKIIRYPAHVDSLLNCNYVMYKNSAFSSKWFYAFITDMEYINDERTDIHIETDVIQTWMFDYSVKASFVEREHVKSDVIGEHTVPEQLEHGEYVCNKHEQSNYAKEDSQIIVLGVTESPNGKKAEGTLYHGLYSGIKYWGFPHSNAGADQIKLWLEYYAESGKLDAVVCMFIAPKRLVTFKEGSETEILNVSTPSTYWINNSTAETTDRALSINSGNLNGYIPRNNKLQCFPYRYLLASNNSGSSAVYHFEQFKDLGGTNNIIQPRFRIDGVLSPSCSIRMTPINYKGVGHNDEEGLNLGKFPILNWTSDVYTNWLTQNGVNIATSLIGSTVQVVGGVGLMATGGGALAGAGSVASGVLGIANTLGEIYQHSLQPPQAEGNLNSGDITTALGKNDFHFYDVSIKKEYAQIIDGYFDMFGYKVNTVKVPNKNHRQSYWFTKTIDVNIDGAIPMKDLRKIKDCYNRGITFWKDTANIGNYSVANAII